MMTDDEESEELKETIREFVNVFKTVWDEIEHQFSGSSREERFRVFSVVAPFITDVFSMAAREEMMEDTVKPDSEKKKKRGV
jgi:hypothetical protein